MDACDLSAHEARFLIGQKRLSPVELLESCITRIEAVNGDLNAVVTTCFDRARDEARRAEVAVMRGEQLPLLHGLPIAIKDLNATKDVRTTYGSRLYADFIPTSDDSPTAAVRKAGAIIVGKTNATEFGAGNNTTNAVFGPTRNPFDLTRTCGGSSGGAAVALAANMVPLCTGGDTGGSLRIPATFCGVSSLRPTVGVVPYDARAFAMTPFQVQGPMARTIEDVGLLLAAMAGDDPVDPLAFPRQPEGYASIRAIDLSNVRVALSSDLGIAPTSVAIRKTFAERLALFSSVFASCDERHPDLSQAPRVNWILRGVQSLYTHKERYAKHCDLLGPVVRLDYEKAKELSVLDIGWALAEQYTLHKTFVRFFTDIDVLICPGATIPPFPIDELYPTEIDGIPLGSHVEWANLTNTLSITGNPVVALPCGLDPTGTPFGLQIVGRRHDDRYTLGVAVALERLFQDNPLLARPVPSCTTF